MAPQSDPRNRRPSTALTHRQSPHNCERLPLTPTQPRLQGHHLDPRNCRPSTALTHRPSPHNCERLPLTPTQTRLQGHHLDQRNCRPSTALTHRQSPHMRAVCQPRSCPRGPTATPKQTRPLRWLRRRFPRLASQSHRPQNPTPTPSPHPRRHPAPNPRSPSHCTRPLRRAIPATQQPPGGSPSASRHT